jgi:hypothetical protein
MKDTKHKLMELPSEHPHRDLELLQHDYINRLKEMEHLVRNITSMYMSMETEMEASSKKKTSFLFKDS